MWGVHRCSDLCPLSQLRSGYPFLGRLQALARAEALVFDDHGQRVDLALLAPRALEPFAAERPE
ncbi:MAG: HWE histidine kinase domain-containing protein, partial [Pseudomonadota bacterium]